MSRRGTTSLALGVAASCSVIHTCCVNMDLAQASTCTDAWGDSACFGRSLPAPASSWSHLPTGAQFSPAAWDVVGGDTPCGGAVAGLWLDLAAPRTPPAVSAPSVFPAWFSNDAIGCLGSGSPTSSREGPPFPDSPAPSASGAQTLRCKVHPRMPVPLVVGRGLQAREFYQPPR